MCPWQIGMVLLTQVEAWLGAGYLCFMILHEKFWDKASWPKREREEFVLLAETCVHYLHPTCTAVMIHAVHSVPFLLSILWLEPAAPVMVRAFLSALRNSRTWFSQFQQKHIPKMQQDNSTVSVWFVFRACLNGIFWLVSPCSFERTANDWRGYFGLYTEIQTENNIEMEHVCLGRAGHFIHLRKNFKELETRT